jgi:poly(3-hydroxybutyrate) depolymerase
MSGVVCKATELRDWCICLLVTQLRHTYVRVMYLGEFEGRVMRLLLLLALVVLLGCQTTSTSTDDTCANCTHTKAYEVAATYGDNAPKGVVVHLHGCGGLYVNNGEWQTDWVNFLNGNGFIVVAPDSFADIRPLSACPNEAGRTDDRKSMIYALRERQSEYAVQKVRAKYPKKKIIVWGHSEGGALIHRMNVEADAFISTGTNCPTERSSTLEASPYFAIVGTNDKYLQHQKNNPLFDGFNDRCKAYMTEPNWEWLVVDGMGHSAELWRQNVERRLSKFLEKVTSN